MGYKSIYRGIWGERWIVENEMDKTWKRNANWDYTVVYRD